LYGTEKWSNGHSTRPTATTNTALHRCLPTHITAAPFPQNSSYRRGEASLHIPHNIRPAPPPSIRVVITPTTRPATTNSTSSPPNHTYHCSNHYIRITTNVCCCKFPSLFCLSIVVYCCFHFCIVLRLASIDLLPYGFKIPVGLLKGCRCTKGLFEFCDSTIHHSIKHQNSCPSSRLHRLVTIRIQKIPVGLLKGCRCTKGPLSLLLIPTMAPISQPTGNIIVHPALF
jgi:hypothetical protein